MCGILGGWWQSPNHIIKSIPFSLNKLSHRGPDHSEFKVYPTVNGAAILGHARLSIIDLSDAGNQPMHSSDGALAIVFNGEIYNYRELRIQLQEMGHSFVSDSDTEVLLHAWLQWGIDCLQRIVGMFAIAVLDKKSGTITCVRDAFGIKPFYYNIDKEFFAFASELPALLELLPQRPGLNWQRSYDYLVHGDYDSNEETFFSCVRQLQPGHWMQINSVTGRLMLSECWWKPRVQERAGWRFDDAVDQVRDHFLNNIRMHLRSDVPIGAALSGGIDSSAIVCAMRYLEPDLPINTFSFIANGDEFNEEIWVDRINLHVNAIPHKVRLTSKELSIDLDDLIRSQGEPFGSTSNYAQYRIYKLARENGITVTLDGQGADEVLGGYNGYPGQRLRSLLETMRISDAWKFLNSWGRNPGASRLLAAKYYISEMTHGVVNEKLRVLDGKGPIPNWIKPNIMREHGVYLHKPRIFPETSTSGRRVIDELSLSLSKRGILSLLRHGDRNSMRFSVESRVPFLTADFANLMLSMPEEYLISNLAQTKHVFRVAMRGIVPDDVLDRKDKIGFATNESDLLRGMNEQIFEWIAQDNNIPFLNYAEINKLFRGMQSGNFRVPSNYWRLINFIRWVQLFKIV